MYHNLSVHFEEYLGHFQFSAITNKVVKNIHGHNFYKCKYSVSSINAQKYKCWLGHIKYMFNFEETASLIS